MVFGIDPVQMAKKELLKVDIDRDKKPDVFEALDAAEAGLEGLAAFFDGLDAEEAFGVLKALNQFRKPAGQKSDAELSSLAHKVVAVPKALRAAKAALESAEAELGKK